MNDPHVEILFYEIGTASDSISYGDPPPLFFENKIGRFNLEDGQLTVEPTQHFSAEQHARQVVDSFLRAWEIATDLKGQIGQIRFTFQHSKIVDRDPLPPGQPQVAHIKAGEIVAIGGRANLHLTCGRYEGPPTAFATTPDVEIAYLRWSHFREGKEKLPAMAYFVLDLIYTRAGGQKRAADTFRISRNVLSKIADLSSRKGDASTARKADFEEMTGAESSWLEAAVKLIILRLGEHATGEPLKDVTMTDLPNLG